MKKLDKFKNIADAYLDKLDMSTEMKHSLKSEASKSKKTIYRKLGFIGLPAVAAIVAFILLFTGVFPTGGSLNVYAYDLMNGIKPQKVETVELKQEFLQSTADFSIDLFKHAYTEGENSLISPTSVYLALGMTANGASGNTLKEFEALLGKKNLNISSLNSYYNTLMKKLTNIKSGKLSIANSVWYRNSNDFKVKESFLQTNADYYNSSAYQADFSSPQTVEDINNWVKTNTCSAIDKIIDNIPGNTIMYLINAVYFEDNWETPYTKNSIYKDYFYLAHGKATQVDFMHSTENSYLKDDEAEGFIKPYKNGEYSFVALLPNEGISIDNYVASLSGESFMKLINSKSLEAVNIALPKFKSEFEIKLVDPLKRMGLKDCFGDGDTDFSVMTNLPKGDVFIGDILHKSSITIDEQGTKAGAVTKIEMQRKGMPEPVSHSINLNRPFVYAIIDNETKLPLFIGTMIKPEI